MAGADPQRWVVIDGTQAKDDVAHAIRTVTLNRLGI
jgi:thymidylate kinase